MTRGESLGNCGCA